MITAHLPAGYLLAKKNGGAGAVMAAALIGAVFPDLDLFWYFFVDNQQYHHHIYWVHMPAFWVVVGALVFPTVSIFKTNWRIPVLVFFLSVAIHLLLDTLAGGIYWLWPFERTHFTLVDVPANFDNWIISFLLHWTFLTEILIWISAFIVMRRQ